MADANINVRLRYTWQGQTMQTEELRPTGSHAVLLDWRTEEDAVESGVPPALAEAIASALVSIGPVAFRTAGDCAWPVDHARVIRAPATGLVRGVVEHLTGQWQSDVVLTRQAPVAATMFDHDWELQGQAALILNSEEDFNETIRSDLATRRQWRDFTFVFPALLLVAPAVDGDGILFAASTDQDLERAIAALRTVLIAAGIPLDEADTGRQANGTLAEIDAYTGT